MCAMAIADVLSKVRACRHSCAGVKIDVRYDVMISGTARRVDEREWTAVEKHKLKGLARKRAPATKIARILKRSVAATATMAAKLGVSLDVAN